MGQNKISIGVSSGLSFHYNSCNDLKYNDTPIRPEYNIGADFAWLLGAKSRLGIELNYEQMGTNRVWDITDLNPTVSTIIKSKMHIYNWGANVSYGYKFLQYKKLDVFGVGSIKYSSRFADREKSTFYDGTSHSTRHLSYDYNKKHGGASLGLRLEYNFDPHWAITLASEYTMYSTSFYPETSPPFQSVRCNMGICLKL
jgi:hypothetical protein